jgi:hypothetical protein
VHDDLPRRRRSNADAARTTSRLGEGGVTLAARCAAATQEAAAAGEVGAAGFVVVAVDDELSVDVDVDDEDESAVDVELSPLPGAADDALFEEPPRLSVL